MISINIDKAKTIAHGKRRDARAAEFAPLDDAIAKQLPGVDAQAVEAERQAVREKYAAMQASIDAAADVDALKAAMPS
jgi:hypothetical protein